MRSYESVGGPLEDWCTEQRELFEQLPPLEVTVEELTQQQEEIQTIRASIGSRKGTVEKVQQLASQFLRDTEVSLKEIIRVSGFPVHGVSLYMYMYLHIQIVYTQICIIICPYMYR